MFPKSTKIDIENNYYHTSYFIMDDKNFKSVVNKNILRDSVIFQFDCINLYTQLHQNQSDLVK